MSSEENNPASNHIAIFFPRDLSDEIMEVLLSPTQVPWQAKERILDRVVPRVVSYGHAMIPGIRKRIEDAGLDPQSITTFRAYEELFPMTSVLKMHEIGQDQFEKKQGQRLEALAFDLKVVSKTAIREEVGATRSSKIRGMVEINRTVADARAASIALAGAVAREIPAPLEIIVNQKEGNVASDLLKSIVIPAFEQAGITAHRISGPEDYQKLKEGIQALLVAGENKIFEVTDLSPFRYVITGSEKQYHSGMFFMGDYNTDYGLFPNFGFKMPFPNFVRVTDTHGRMFRMHSGEPDLTQKGRIVVDTFFSAYELQTSWAALKNSLIQARELFDLGQFTWENLDAFWRDLLGDNYIFREAFLTSLAESGIDKTASLVPNAFSRLYASILHNYMRHSVRFGVPSSTFMLKVGLPLYAGMNEHNGVLHDRVNLSSITAPGEPAYIAIREDFPIKYPSTTTPYISYNIVGTITDEVAEFPCLRTSFLNMRILNTLAGKNLMGTGKDGYTVTTGVLDTKGLEQVLAAATAYTKPRPLSSKVSFDDVAYMLSHLVGSIEGELEGYTKGEASMIAVFSDMTRIPISEIRTMVERARTDFVANNSIGLKRMLYAAFVDPKADVLKMQEEVLNQGLEALASKKPISPATLVTPGNITLYDSVCLMAHVLSAKLTDESEGRFTMVVKPSESDVTFNYLVHQIHKVAAEIDPDNAKGLRTLFQKGYWPSEMDKQGDTLKRLMQNVKVGIYYGKAKTFAKVRFEAALENVRDRYSKEDLETLLHIASRDRINFKTDALEVARQEGIRKDLVQDVEAFFVHHYIFPETLNAVVITPDGYDLEQYAQDIMGQVISMRGADCTNVSRVWVPRQSHLKFVEAFEAAAYKLTYGNVNDPAVSLAQHETDTLKMTQTIISGRPGDTKIIPPLDKSGKPAQQAISPNEHYSGVIVTNIDARVLVGEETAERETYIEHLSKEVPLPWLNIIVYDTPQELLGSMKEVLARYKDRTGYPRFLYVAGMGGDAVHDLERAIETEGMADLFKKGAEVNQQFMYYRPHQGSFLINALVQ